MKNNEVYLYIKKTNKTSDFKMWMAFPGIYSFSLSSLGYLWMYKCIDEIDGVNIERICSDTESTLFKKKDINLVGFSFSFDMDFLNIFSIMDKYNLPLKTSEREENHPLIFAGGPVVTANPLPYSDFFDFIIIGDGEDVNVEVVKLCKANKNKSKKEVLKLLSQIKGIYVPSIKQNKVKKLTKTLSECIYTPIISENAFFKNTFILEMSRGCYNRCGFCIASYLNLPLRFMPYDELIEIIDFGLSYTNKIALLGAQVCAHPHFENVLKYIYSKIQNGQKIEMSISSLRVDAITPDVIKTFVAAGQKNITLAIEAGSERLRKVINKNLTEEQILNAVDICIENGLKGLKFYGMLGLPTETQEDINSLIQLAKKLKKKNKWFNLSFGFSTFVPKAHTPFQWCGREETRSLEDKISYLKKEFHKLGISANFSSPKWDYYQAVLSRGDSSLGNYLIDVYKKGGKLGAFKSAAKENKIDTDYFALVNYPLDKELPWNFIEVCPGVEFLTTEHNRLLNHSHVS